MSPKSSAAELSALRDEAMARDGRCRWPGCTYTEREAPLQMAHLVHRGMGGSKYANRLENVAMLCEIHHRCLDGVIGTHKLRWELNELLRFVVGSVEPKEGL